MILTAHQPNYLPYPGFFHKIVNADAFLIVDNVQFVKRGEFGWIHRNRIRSPEGWVWMTVPVMTKGKYHQTIQETTIDTSVPWARKHLKAIEWNYKTAPYLGKYHAIFEDIYLRRWESLCDLNVAFIAGILDALGVKRTLQKTSELGVEGKASQLIVEMCKKIGADTYLSGVHGRDYLDLPLFEASGIKVIFQEFKCPVYPQCQKGEFISDLSIVDMLFNCGDRTMELLRGES